MNTQNDTTTDTRADEIRSRIRAYQPRPTRWSRNENAYDEERDRYMSEDYNG
jgi:hypothetical protein